MRPRKPPRLYFRDKAGYLIVEGGKEISCHTRDREEAEKAFANYVSGTIAKAIDAYLERETRTDFNKQISKPVRAYWGSKFPQDVTEVECRKYRAQRPVKDSTVRHELSFLRSALAYVGGYPKTALKGLGWLPPKPEPRTDYFLTRYSVAQRLRVARRSRRHICRLILVCIYSGTRPGAALNLHWTPSLSGGWVDLQAGLLYRGSSVGNKRKKVCRIHERLLVHLRRWKRLDDEAGIPWVIHYRGKPIKRAHKAWKWIAAATGQGPDGPHICRHTCATWLMQAGVSYHEASGFLSVSPDTLERHYAHHRPDFQQAAASARGR